MDRTQLTVANLRQWLVENPKELDTLKEYITEIADKLDSGEYTLMDMSGVIKKWKRPHGQEVFRIFRDAYQAAVIQGD